MNHEFTYLKSTQLRVAESQDLKPSIGLRFKMSRFYFLICAFVLVFFVSVQSVPAAHYNLSNYNYGMVNSKTIRLHKKTILEDHYEQKKEIKVAIPSSQRRFARSVLKNENSRWPSPIIPFEISPNMSSKGVKMIHKAMRHYQNLTCLIFKPKSDLDIDYIYFDNRPGACISDSTGRKGGRQDINLDEKYCLNTSELAIHEIFHALGFNHEHTRPDRDDYITVHWENIMPAANHSFMKEKWEDVDTLGLPYDYRSIVHIHAFGGSINGNATLSAKVPNQTLGSTGRLSELDVRKINILFKCNDSLSTTSTLPGTNKPIEITTSTPQIESTTTMKPRTESTTTAATTTTTTTMKPKTDSTTTTTTTMKPQTESTTTTTTTMKPETKRTTTTTTTTMKPKTERTTPTTKKPQTKRTTTTTTTTTKKPQPKRTTTTTTTTTKKPQPKRTTTTTTTMKPKTERTTPTTKKPQTKRTTTTTTTTTKKPQPKRTTTTTTTTTKKPQPKRTTTTTTTTTTKPQTRRPQTKKPVIITMRPPTRRPRRRRTTTRRPPTRKPVTTTPKPKTCRNDCYFFYFCIGYVVCAVTSALDWVWGLWC